jgi:hypothetical protein
MNNIKTFILKSLLMILLYTFINEDSAQTRNTSFEIKTNPGQANKDTSKNDLDNNLANFPFQIGIDIGTGLPPIKFEKYAQFGITGYLDINFYKRILFFELEMGGTKINRKDGISSYVSIGLSLNAIKFGKSRIIFQGGFGGYSKVESYTLLPIATIRYMFVLHKLIGLTTSVKFPFVGSYIPYFTIGTQFCTN